MYSDVPLGVFNFQGLSRVPAPAAAALGLAGALGLATLAGAALVAAVGLAAVLGLAAAGLALAARGVLRFATGLDFAVMLSLPGRADT